MSGTSGGQTGTAPQRSSVLSGKGQAVALMHFDHVEKQVALAVTKAALLVAASAFIVGAYVRVMVVLHIFEALGPTDLSTILFIIGGAFLMIGFTCALVAVFPKRGRGDLANALYYGWVSSVLFDEYKTQFQKNDAEDELDENMLRQIWSKSNWLDRMFWYTAASIWCIIIGSWFCIVALAFGLNHLPSKETTAQTVQAQIVPPVPIPPQKPPQPNSGKR
jgi:hypothetical protein